MSSWRNQTVEFFTYSFIYAARRYRAAVEASVFGKGTKPIQLIEDENRLVQSFSSMTKDISVNLSTNDEISRNIDNERMDGARICMITLTDVRNDLRIRKEAESLAEIYNVHVVSLCENEPRHRFDFRRLKVINIPLVTRRLPKSPLFWLMKYLEFLLRAAYSAARVRARVYHGHELAGSLPSLFAARLRRAKFIYDAHELEADRVGAIQKSPWLHRLMLWSLRLVMRQADHVICASESRADIMLAEYGARERPTPILNVTPRAGMPNSEVKTPACPVNPTELNLVGKRVVIYQGTLAPGRGLDRVVSALNHLDDDVVLLVLGSGTTFDSLIAQAERQATRHRLIMLGQVPADSLVAYMRLAHVGLAIYLNTCRNNYHCAPNKIFEYASVGLPVVGPNFPDVEAVVSQYDIGRTFDPESPDSIAAAIREVLNDPNRRETMSRNARLLKEHINWESQEAKLRGIYKKLLL
jgi:glycosyltransferase involved in cell wall biosynthesis